MYCSLAALTSRTVYMRPLHREMGYIWRHILSFLQADVSWIPIQYRQMGWLRTILKVFFKYFSLPSFIYFSFFGTFTRHPMGCWMQIFRAFRRPEHKILNKIHAAKIPLKWGWLRTGLTGEYLTSLDVLVVITVQLHQWSQLVMLMLLVQIHMTSDMSEVTPLSEVTPFYGTCKKGYRLILY